jgi:hypothetical protein
VSHSESPAAFQSPAPFVDWGVEYVTLDGLRLEDGEPVRVLWPDGSETDDVVRVREVDAPFYDRGHRCPGSNFVATIPRVMRGAPVEVPVRMVKLKRRTR